MRMHRFVVRSHRQQITVVASEKDGPEVLRSLPSVVLDLPIETTLTPLTHEAAIDAIGALERTRRRDSFGT
ncbi:hypothetical protein [Arthrobacter sp. StoSoilB22]|uniref:hypothetical protein n=1 Tax=Arthrobacter sp. StoSoilB22 TaxID=2830996 RepID=UPI001CC7B018|nr:hypothetical protein [Arthrobacter sp. StoSoilB22]BCW62885.1 hypothetical protein StoSoilB22_18580 [Arthrobacter sp. StoSoilB22]